MNKLNLKLSSLVSSLCAMVLGFLGFGCSSDSDEPLMYGTPTGYFEIKGEVTDEAGEPIPDVEISAIPNSKDYTIIDANEENYYFYLLARDTTTNNKGSYTLAYNEGSGFYENVKVVAMPLSGDFMADSTYVELNYVKDASMKDRFWYHGKAEAEVNFKLKRKSEE